MGGVLWPPVSLRGCHLFEEDADLAVFVVTAIEQVIERGFLELPDGVDQIGLQATGGLAMVAVRSPQRLGQDRVDDPEFKTLPGGQF